MRAMSATPDGTSTPRSSISTVVFARWRAWLLWAGAPLCIVGIVQHRLWEDWASGRFVELLVLAAIAAALAWPIRRFARWSWPSAIACVWCLALLPFAGVLPVLATLLLAAAAVATGGLVARRESAALQAAVGLALIGGTIGWLLPVPVHYRPVYLAASLTLIFVRWHALRDVFAATVSSWRARTDEAPYAAAFAVTLVGLAGTSCWLPTLQHDDVAYHLRLPWELLQAGRYAMDPSTQIWALAPWFGDVVQAMAQVTAGDEARGPINGLWLVVAAAGLFRLTGALGGHAHAAWMAVALFASLPLTAALAGGMQTELPTVAMLAWLAVLIVRRSSPLMSGPYAGGALFGALLGLKFGAAATAILLLPWAAAQHGRSISFHRLCGGLAIALFVGGSSYAYAAWIAGNPFLPLFGDHFPSLYLPAPIHDDRWFTGFSWSTPWDITFDSHRFLEGFDGGGGFVLVSLLGAWLLAMTQRGLRGPAVACSLLLIVPLTQIQYLRYAIPALALVLAVVSVASFCAAPRTAAWLLMGSSVFSIAFQSNADWIRRTGALKQAVIAAGQDAPLFLKYVPERQLIAQMRRSLAPNSRVLALDPAHPFVAELGSIGVSNAWYNPQFQAKSRLADADDSGQAWADLLLSEGITDVIVRANAATSAQLVALVLTDAEKREVAGDAAWWRLPVQPD